MMISGYEVDDTIRCWCGLESPFHHLSSGIRKDNKRTVWYKCPDRHRMYVEITGKGYVESKEDKTKKKEKNKDAKEERVQDRNI